MGLVICGLVQPPAPPQRDQVRDASAASQWSGRGDLPSPRCRLRTGPPAKSTPVVKINALLASTRGGLDQSATLRKRHHSSYVGDGRLSGDRGVIFPDSHRYCSKKGGVECMAGKIFSNLISALNPALGEAYKRERWHSGTTEGAQLSFPSAPCRGFYEFYGLRMSRRDPDLSTRRWRFPVDSARR